VRVTRMPCPEHSTARGSRPQRRAAGRDR
jgi:hypothetical protein